ncbi:MAG: adenylate/guanylate cyclase domain-containing protein [Chloroflexi bacterium]|nr:adenylate/guanylate cyclase domain-containing protein [Chloroflexota bacterium]
MMFADIRGSTSIAEKVGPAEFANLLNRFYEVTTKSLLLQNAVVDKMIGDEVMAFFVPAFEKETQAAALRAAVAILRRVGYRPGKEPWLPVGIGINFGEAYVGKVGTGEVNDFTALGDTVNTAARLQSHAKAGEDGGFRKRLLAHCIGVPGRAARGRRVARKGRFFRGACYFTGGITSVRFR